MFWTHTIAQKEDSKKRSCQKAPSEVYLNISPQKELMMGIYKTIRRVDNKLLLNIRPEELLEDYKNILNNYNLEVLRFSGGELHLNIESLNLSPDTSNLSIYARIENSDDAMIILLLVDALRKRLGDMLDISLVLPYLPYSRQDRVCATGDSFSLEVFARIINSLKLKKVVTFDVHSSVAEQLFDNFENISVQDSDLRSIINTSRQTSISPTDVMLVAPDFGSLKRIQKYASELDSNSNILISSKERCPKTGKIFGFKLYSTGEGLDFDGHLYIVDDICDGGYTFILAAKSIREKMPNIKSLNLVITHGIFSNGMGVLTERFDTITTMDTIDKDFVYGYDELSLFKYQIVKKYFEGDK